jgi:hypothetical protein
VDLSLGIFGPQNMPGSLTPEHDEAKEQVFDDEVDPSRREKE